MMGYAGLVLLCCLGIVAAGEVPLPSDAIQQHHSMGVTTVCVQVRGPHSPVCGPMVDPPSDKGDPAARMNEQQAMFQQFPMEQNVMMRNSQAFVAPPPPPSAVLQDVVQGVPVYRMQGARAQEDIQNFMKSSQHQQGPPPVMSVFRVADPPPMQVIPAAVPKCSEPVMRLAGPPPGLIPLNPPEHFVNGPERLRTFPFAPFGYEQQHQQQYQMRQAQPVQPLMRASMQSQQMMPMMRAADCPDNFQQQPAKSAQMMRSSSSSLDESTLRQAQAVDSLEKECQEQKLEIKKKQEEISDLKQHISKLESAKASSSSTMIEQKTITTKSSQDSVAGLTQDDKPSLNTQEFKKDEYQEARRKKKST